MSLFSDCKIKVAASLYWLGNIINIFVQSKAPGYYPKASLEFAKAQALQAPLPLYDILLATILLTTSLLAICFLAVRNTYGPMLAVIFSLTLTVGYSLSTPTDIGGIHYALTQYTICTLLLSVLFCIAFYGKKFLNFLSKSLKD